MIFFSKFRKPPPRFSSKHLIIYSFFSFFFFFFHDTQFFTKTPHEENYSPIITPYDTPQVYFLFPTFCASLALSAAAAIDTDSYVGCGHVRIAMTLVLLALLVMDAVLRPFCRMRDLLMDVLIKSTQMVACVLMAIGYYQETEKGAVFDMATLFLIVCAVLILLKVLLDVGCELYVLMTRTRARLQEGVFSREAKSVPSDMSSTTNEVEVDLAETLLLPMQRERESSMDGSHITLDQSLLSAPGSPGVAGRGARLPVRLSHKASYTGDTLRTASESPSSPVTPLKQNAFGSRSMSNSTRFARGGRHMSRSGVFAGSGSTPGGESLEESNQITHV